VHTADGASAMESLSVTSFPFLSLVRILPSSSRPNNSNHNHGDSMSPQERKLELLFRMQGPALQSVSPATLHTHLSSSLRHYEGILSEQTLRRLQRLEEVRLREEQDREYRETLEADRERQRLKKEEEDRAREEEKRLKEEQEKLEREKREKLEKARSLLEKSTGEPSVISSSSDDSQPVKMTRVRLMLPSGKRLERKFKGDDTIDTIRAFLVLHFEETGTVMENFQLNSNYPRKALVDGDKTLESEGLCPQAVIMVQDLDA
jgi:FAS-associated factor 2